MLVVVAPQDRKMRIEVGYGLEGTLTDVGGGRIIRERDDAARSRTTISTAAWPRASTRSSAQLEGTRRRRASWQTRRRRRRRPAAASFPIGLQRPEPAAVADAHPARRFIFGIIGLFTFIGIMTPGMGWFLYFFLIPFWAMFPIVDPRRDAAR